jgi:uncharacterized membrane protein
VKRFRPKHLAFFALSLVILPFLLAFVTSLFTEGDMWNEGTGGGAWLWLLFLSLPVAFLLGLASVIWWLVRDIRKRGN